MNTTADESKLDKKNIDYVEFRVDTLSGLKEEGWKEGMNEGEKEGSGGCRCDLLFWLCWQFAG